MWAQATGTPSSAQRPRTPPAAPPSALKRPRYSEGEDDELFNLCLNIFPEFNLAQPAGYQKLEQLGAALAGKTSRLFLQKSGLHRPLSKMMIRFTPFRAARGPELKAALLQRKEISPQ